MRNERPFSKIAVAGLILALAGALITASSGFGYQINLWHFKTGFKILEWGAYTASTGLIISLLAIYFTAIKKVKRGTLCATIGSLIALMTIAPPLLWSKTAQSVPRIHDITTDSDNPPEFFDVLPLRANAVNPVEYGGEELAAVQRKAYPDIKPLTLTAPPQEVLPVAIQAANVMGWHVISADRSVGRIEATASTFWFGFTDDIVIRVTSTTDGSRVDVRSLSRVGVSDAGTNAKRITIYLKVLKARFET